LPPWEFWPAWLAYLPVIPWIGWLALRHGGPGTVTAANPGVPDGGLVGESKFAILQRVPRPWVTPSARIGPGPMAHRLETLKALAAHTEVRFPLVLKPDVGQRGIGVRRVTSLADARDYLGTADYAIVAQPWHPGPGEAGIFYWRHPEQTRGQIFSITDKVFPAVVGDGQRTLGELIHAHSRLSRQATVFRARLSAQWEEVPPAGERVPLGIVGNHCQGTEFRDGRHLWSPALEARVDDIARRIPGFFVGRFDVRYRSLHRFRSGEDLSIIELNGVTGEPTDIYDPDRDVWSAYRALFTQWRLVFEIGAANRRLGHRPSSLARLAHLAREYLTDARRFPVSS
jgi:hypothetical protein